MADAYYEKRPPRQDETHEIIASTDIMIENLLKDAKHALENHKVGFRNNAQKLDEVMKKLRRLSLQKMSDMAGLDPRNSTPEALELHSNTVQQQVDYQIRKFCSDSTYPVHEFHRYIYHLLKVSLNSQVLDLLNGFRSKMFEHKAQATKQQDLIKSLQSPIQVQATPKASFHAPHVPPLPIHGLQASLHASSGQVAVPGMMGSRNLSSHHALYPAQSTTSRPVHSTYPSGYASGTQAHAAVPASAAHVSIAAPAHAAVPGGAAMAATSAPSSTAYGHGVYAPPTSTPWVPTTAVQPLEQHRGMKREAIDDVNGDIAVKRAREMGYSHMPSTLPSHVLHPAAEDPTVLKFPPLPERFKKDQTPMLLSAVPLHRLLHRVGLAALSDVPQKEKEKESTPPRRRTRSSAGKRPDIGGEGVVEAVAEADPGAPMKPREFAAEGVHETISEGVQMWLEGVLSKVSEILHFRKNDKWDAEADTRSHTAEQLAAVERWSARVVEHEREERFERLKRLARSKAGDDTARKALEQHKKAEIEERERQNMSDALAAFTAPKKRKVDPRKFTLPPSVKTAPTWNKGSSVIIYVKKEPGTDGDGAEATGPAPKSYITMRDFEFFLENNPQYSKSEALFQAFAK